MIRAHKIILTSRGNPWVAPERVHLTEASHEDVWAAADAQLAVWQARLPHSYHHQLTVDVEALFKDGQWFRVKYNLPHRSVERPDLARYLSEVGALLSGAGQPIYKPRWLVAWTLGLSEERMDWYADFIERHAFGVANRRPAIAMLPTPAAAPVPQREPEAVPLRAAQT